jgi:biotin operon repressor
MAWSDAAGQFVRRINCTIDGTATLVGKLLLLIAAGPETSASLADKLNVSPRQVNRHALQLIEAGWQVERVGEWLKHDYHFVLVAPTIVLPAKPKRTKKRTPSSKKK